MKKNILTFALIIISILSQAQNKMNVEIFDFTADKKSIDVSLLVKLKTEFHFQFQSKYGNSFSITPSDNNITKIRTCGYAEIKVAKNTDLVILGEIITNENSIPTGIKITFLPISGSPYRAVLV